MIEVQDRSPWSFDKRLILLKRFNGNVSPSNVTFQHSLFGFMFLTFLLKV